MASFIVLEPESASPDNAEKAVMVRDGFAVMAFILPLFWFLWHRMWIEALAFLALGLLLAGLGSLPGFSTAVPLVSLLLSLLVGFEARNLRVIALRRRGWREWGVIEAANREEVEIRYAEKALQVARPDAAVPSTVPAPISRPAQANVKHSGPAFGLLDYPRKN